MKDTKDTSGIKNMKDMKDMNLPAGAGLPVARPAARCLAVMWLSVFMLVSATMLSGCGFHLQDKAELPAQMQQTYLAVQHPYSRLATRLETLLEQNGVQVVSSPKDVAILEVPMNRMRKEIQSIGDNARVREYQLRLTVNFRLLDKDGTELIPMQNLELARVYGFNEQDILSAEREDEYLRQEISDTVASMILRRIGTWSETATF